MFEDWMGEVRRGVDAHLERTFGMERQRALELAPEAIDLIDALAALTMRGGKRLRPLLLVAAFQSVREGEDWRRTISACSALELLQSYLLIHDDWMDGDEQRRGGPSVHHALSLKWNDSRLGASMGILSGDLASAFAQKLILESDVPKERLPAVLAAFVRMQIEVVFGQALDLLATKDVSRMQRLKTGSYTVEGPLRLGALLAGANTEQLAVLQSFAAPLGEAFQLRDDLLGTFGNSAETGKPTGNDLRAGKRTALVRECERLVPEASRDALTTMFGRADASELEVRKASDLLERSGARKAVETRLGSLLEDAISAIRSEALLPLGRTMLEALAHSIVTRSK